MSKIGFLWQNTERNGIRIGFVMENVAKCKENEGKRRFGKGRRSGGKGRPGGMRDGRILRFAEAGTDSAFGYFCLCLQHGLARKGLAVFNRSAHSAVPGNGQYVMDSKGRAAG